MKNLGFDSMEDARKFHKSVYSSWARHIKRIDPERAQLITVSNAGNLMIDNRVIFTDWTKKVIKDKKRKNEKT